MEKSEGNEKQSKVVVIPEKKKGYCGRQENVAASAKTRLEERENEGNL